LYSNGNENTAVTGGWSVAGAEKTGSYINFDVQGGTSSSKSANAFTNNSISLAAYSKVIFSITVLGGQDYEFTFGVGSASNTTNLASTTVIVGGEASVNISSVSSGYIRVSVWVNRYNDETSGEAKMRVTRVRLVI